ncbi:choice-of-anchor I family protein [Flavonifractor sp. An91]|uniref:choice-of-anchor I family protein n=1 Tax=Flavonifractor sp. An91 TaxID=1965665 RepID=UPI0013A65E2C|nr:choice-of-anchor I family protein [Flavonifractor sp. An91]
MKRNAALSLLLALTLTLQLAPAASAVGPAAAAPAAAVPAEINAETVWRYLDDGSDPAAGLTDRTDWADPTYNDSGWETAKGSFGAKNGGADGMDGGHAITTLLDQYKEDGKTDKEAFFFRTTVQVEEPDAVTQITGSLLYDDAATVYLNGAKIAGFDDSDITSNLQYGGSNDSAPKTGEISVTAPELLELLVEGENTVAVELHQGRASSSDIYFAFTSLEFSTEPLPAVAALLDGETQWSYLDNNTDPAGDPEGAGYDRTSWTAADFDDSKWETASGPFGSKRGAAELESGYTAETVLDGCDGSSDTPAYFFRTTFSIPSLDGMTKLVGTLQHDDGVIVYINGQRVAAFDDVACDASGNSLGHGFDANLQYGGANSGTPITSTFTLTDLTLLQVGENTIAVELHNGRQSSSDVWFHFTDLHLTDEPISSDVTDISLFVGADETERNLTWYTGYSQPGQVLVAKESELTDGQMPESAACFDAVSSLSNDGGLYSNQATITGLEANATYAYQLVNGEVSSEIHTFTTGETSDGFSFALAGDPQIGAGSTASDIEGWDKTLGLLASDPAFDGLDFLLSAGDQVNTANNEEEYNGYLNHEELTGLATATVVGNHDSSSAAYSQHFNEPNVSGKGTTTASSDYYFVYGNTLFMVLNSNSMSTAEHKAFMENAIAATAGQGIQWKVVTFHHSIYSVASHAVEGDILQRREELVPIFEELDIDVVLMGHDHVYVRSYMMNGLTPITESDKYTDADGNGVPEAVYAPNGILYVTANSASGSKFYNIQTNLEFPYAAVMNQERVPNISRVDVTDDSFTVTTYRTSDMSVVDTFTIYRNARPAEDLTPAKGFANGETDLNVTAIGRYTSGQYDVDGGVMEIVAYNTANRHAYAVNGKSGVLAILPMGRMEAGDTLTSLRGRTFDVRAAVKAMDESFQYGDMTSVAVSPDGSTLAVALQADSYKEAGRVALFACDTDGDLELTRVVEVGVQPDMITFADNNSTVLTADEGEPREGYGSGTSDPKGSVSIVNVAAGEATVVTFDDFDTQREELAQAGIVLKKGTAPSVDFEPEYIAVSGGKAYVTLQEANAIAVLDIASKTFTGVYSAGFEDYSVTPVDIDKEDEKYNPQRYEGLLGIRMPDGIAAFEVNGTTYLVTANEGDSREWGDYLNENEAKKGAASPAGNIKEDQVGGKVVYFGEEAENESAKGYDGLDKTKDYLFGGRSFTVYEVNGDGITEVFTSGDDFERLTAQYLPEYYNCSNDNAVLDDRSGKKGPEAESITVGTVDGRTYAFVALERTGGVMVYDVTEPADSEFVNYINSRDFDSIVPGSGQYEDGELDKWVTGGDVAPEGLAFIPADVSPTDKDLLLAACEVSGTVAAYELTPNQAQEPDDGNQGGGGGGSGSATYSVTVPGDIANGAVTVTPSRASGGQTVTVTATPEEGYEVERVTVTDSSGNEIAVSEKGDGKYSFIMPRGGARVTAEFAPIGEEPQPAGLPFTDVSEGAWYYDAVEYAYENGLMKGTSAATFAPGGTLSRAMLAQVLWNLEGNPAGSAGGYSDVAPGAWYYGAVQWASNQGVVNGIGDGSSFAPDGSITREQMAVMLYRYAQYKGYDVSQAGMEVREFTDYDQISGWALEGMTWAVNAGIISGVGSNTLNPLGTASRAEAAAILMRFLEAAER